MSFNPGTCTLNWTPSAPVGTKFYVKFRVTTSTGGTDAILVEFTVTQPTQPGAARAEVATGPVPDGPNPTRSRFVLMAPSVPGASAALSVFDLTGRRVAVVTGPSGAALVWEGKDQSGTLVGPGIYLYRMEVGNQRREGKVVVFR